MSEHISVMEVERKARAADHAWPSNHAHYMPEPCAEILTEWLYPMAEEVLTLLEVVEAAHALRTDGLVMLGGGGRVEQHLRELDFALARLDFGDAT